MFCDEKVLVHRACSGKSYVLSIHVYILYEINCNECKYNNSSFL